MEKPERKYRTRSTSDKTAKVENDLIISSTSDSSDRRTRRVARAEIVDNARESEASVKVTLLHQRRHRDSDQWEDIDSFNLTSLRAGEEVRLSLKSGETKRLYDHLRSLYEIGSDGPPMGERNLRVIDEDEENVVSADDKQLLEKFVRSEGDYLFEMIDDIEPQLFDVHAMARRFRERSEIVEVFEDEMDKGRWEEHEWDSFFNKNRWIFGHGLAYQFLNQRQRQPHYGGMDVSGKGTERGDYLMSTAARAKFTVLVEIKKPNSQLVSDDKYRNGAHELGKDLVGGISQLQANCKVWEVEGSRRAADQDWMRDEGIYTYEPRGILVVGHTEQLVDNRDKIATFERFRRNLHNPEIVTFDELYERAKYIVSLDKQ